MVRGMPPMWREVVNTILVLVVVWLDSMQVKFIVAGEIG